MKPTIYHLPFVRDIRSTLARRVALVVAFPILSVVSLYAAAIAVLCYTWSRNNRVLVESFRKYWRA